LAFPIEVDGLAAAAKISDVTKKLRRTEFAARTVRSDILPNVSNSRSFILATSSKAAVVIFESYLTRM
jgi:hypothetical protein